MSGSDKGIMSLGGTLGSQSTRSTTMEDYKDAHELQELDGGIKSGETTEAALPNRAEG